MQTFGEQLNVVRKEHRMTQDQLAQAMNISRTTVSRWETGRALPDIETIKQLSHLLDYNFFMVQEIADSLHEEIAAQAREAGQELPAEEIIVDAKPETPTVKKPAGTAKWQLLLAFLLGALCMALAGILLLPYMPQMSEGLVQTTAAYTSHDLEWYQNSADERVEGRAFVEIIPKMSPIMGKKTEPFSASNPGWIYQFLIREVNGVTFYPSQYVVTVFDELGHGEPMVFGREHAKAFFKGDEMVAGKTYEFQGGFPMQSVSGVGLLLSGTDAYGNELEFHGYAELSQEIEAYE